MPIQRIGASSGRLDQILENFEATYGLREPSDLPLLQSVPGAIQMARWASIHDPDASDPLILQSIAAKPL